MRITLKGKDYLSHRLAWFYMTGAWPEQEIDHINGVRDDNRFANLREADRQINCQNVRKPYKNNRTGLLGVKPSLGKFVARIYVDGKERHLGTFKTPGLAHAAYVAAKRELHKGGTI